MQFVKESNLFFFLVLQLLQSLIQVWSFFLKWFLVGQTKELSEVGQSNNFQ